MVDSCLGHGCSGAVDIVVVLTLFGFQLKMKVDDGWCGFESRYFARLPGNLTSFRLNAIL